MHFGSPKIYRTTFQHQMEFQARVFLLCPHITVNAGVHMLGQ